MRFLIFFLFSYCFLQKLVFFEIDSVRAGNLLQQFAVVRAAEPEDTIVCELGESLRSEEGSEEGSISLKFDLLPSIIILYFGYLIFKDFSIDE